MATLLPSPTSQIYELQNSNSLNLFVLFACTLSNRALLVTMTANNSAVTGRQKSRSPVARNGVRYWLDRGLVFEFYEFRTHRFNIWGIFILAIFCHMLTCVPQSNPATKSITYPLFFFFLRLSPSQGLNYYL